MLLAILCHLHLFFQEKRMDKHDRLLVGFLRWLEHFKHQLQPTKENPGLLILDGHASRKELAVIKYTRQNYIHMPSTPPYTAHKIQPLDRTFFKPYKSSSASASAV